MLRKIINIDISRNKKMLLSSVASLTNQFISFISGFILPSLFLSYYGSSVNGLVSSITQFLGFIVLCELGVGSVVQSALYKPLAEKNTYKVNQIVISSERFFKKIAFILLLYTLGLICFYPYTVSDSFEFGYTSLLIMVISINSFSQYYFGMSYKLLLNADQLAFVQLFLNSFLLIMNIISCVVMIKNGFSIHVVKLVTAVIFVLQPLVLSYIARKRYNIDMAIKVQGEPIKQKWNGLAQHIAAVILENTDIAVLTLFSTLENVSIYYVYHLVVNGLKKIINSMTTGMQALFGNMYAKKEMDALYATFNSFEWFIHTVVTLLYGGTILLIIPFVSVYTSNVTDANYIVPSFAILISIAQCVYCIRIPYNMMVLAAGHYKQTQVSALVEAGLNVCISIIAVYYWGLVGVAVGTLVAMTYRTIYLVLYISKNILPRGISGFIKHIIVDFVSIATAYFITKCFNSFFSLTNLTYFAWVTLAVKAMIVLVSVSFLVNLMVNPNELLVQIKKVNGKFLKKNKGD